MNKIREIILTAAGTAGGLAACLLGGWDGALAVLLIFMALDYLSGLMLAGLFHKSPKSESGALESKAGWKGLCRKGMTLCIVLAAASLDRLMGVDFVRNGVISGFIVNEGISLLENAGLMGVPYPKPLRDALDLLQKRDERE